MLAFGSNLGDRPHNCQRGIALLAPSLSFLGFSPWLTTEPLQAPGYDTSAHEPYLNFVADIATHLTPSSLYQEIVRIEDLIGHQRSRKWLPRHLDIDILLWAHNHHTRFADCPPLRFNAHESLVIPHAQLGERQFLLQALKSFKSPVRYPPST